MHNKLKLSISVSLIVLLLTACSNTNNEKNDLENPQTEQETPSITPDSGEPETPQESPGDNEPVEPNEETPDETNSNILNNILDLSIVTLVNKQNSLTESDVPSDLVTVDVPTVLENPEVNQLRKVAANALKSMFDEAIKDDIYLHARSGYRSYNTQVQLFQSYTDRNGEEAANRYSAKAGQSEHQTGLVMDVTAGSVNFQLSEEFGETAEGTWLREHAHEFGFIIRYPKHKEDITGYIYEPWHIRYLGIEMATKVYESGLTYEELLDKEGIIDEVRP